MFSKHFHTSRVPPEPSASLAEGYAIWYKLYRFLRFKFRHSYRIVNTKIVNQALNFGCSNHKWAQQQDEQEKIMLSRIWDCGKSFVSVACWRLLPRAYMRFFLLSMPVLFVFIVGKISSKSPKRLRRLHEFWAILYTINYICHNPVRSLSRSRCVCFIKTNPFWNEGSKLKRNTKWSIAGRFSVEFNSFFCILPFVIIIIVDIVIGFAAVAVPFGFIVDFPSLAHSRISFHSTAFSPSQSASFAHRCFSFHSIVVCRACAGSDFSLLLFCVLGVTVVIVLIRKCAHI